MKKQENRNSSFELLRIIAIVLIIMHHFSYHNELYLLPTTNFNSYLGLLLFSVGKIGVAVFILISGYFMVNKKISIKKMIMLWLEVEFYIIIMTIITTIIKGSYPFKIRDTLKLLMPIMFNKYWFITAYMGLYTLSPLINMVITKITKNQFKALIKINFVIFIIIYSFLHNEQFITTGNNLSIIILFCFLYMIGAYIKLYDISFLKDKNKLVLLAYLFLSYTLYYTILVVIRMYFKNVIIDYYIDFKFILVFIISILAFYIFKKIKISSKLVNYISSSVFGIYLFQSHPLFGGKFLYRDLIQSTKFYNSKYLIIYILLITIIVFIVGLCTDKMRKVFEKIICNSKKFNSFISLINTKVNKKIGVDYFE